MWTLIHTLNTLARIEEGRRDVRRVCFAVVAPNYAPDRSVSAVAPPFIGRQLDVRVQSLTRQMN